MNVNKIYADSIPPVTGGIPYLSDDDSNIYLFHIGIPNPGTFPKELMNEAISSEDFNWNEVMQYSPVVGDLQGREGIVNLYRHRGETAKIDELLITAGIAESFDLLPELFINPGDVIFTEDPSYPWGIRSFKLHRAQIKAIRTDSKGMDLNILEDEIKKAGNRAKMIYTMPIFHNPMGIVTPEEQRVAVGQLAEKYNLVIIEDDPYRELAFDEPAPISMRHHFPDRVINLGTLSKTIGGGIRIGWVWAQPEIIDQLSQIKHTGSTTFTARAAGHIMCRPQFYQHLEICRTEYKRRRDLCLKALLENGMGSWITYETKGGFYYWLKLPADIDPEKFYSKSFKNGIYILSGTHFSDNPELKKMFRLSFSFEKEEKMVTGIRMLAELAKSNGIKF